MAVAKVVVNEKDKFGVERFAALSAEFSKFKLSKDFQNRFNRIETVFTYRRDVAYALHHVEEAAEHGWGFRSKLTEARNRLESFKPVQFFLDALQTLLTEVRQEEAAKPPARTRRCY